MSWQYEPCGLVLLLKTLQHLGYLRLAASMRSPPEVREFVAGQIGLLWDCSDRHRFGNKNRESMRFA